MKNAGAYLAILIGLALVVLAVLGFRSPDDLEKLPSANTSNATLTASSAPVEDPASEAFTNQPGAIIAVEQVGEGEYWSLAIDLLTPNRAWVPDGSSTHGGFFLNRNPKVRNLTVTAETAAYRCDGAEATERVAAASFIAYVQDVLRRAQTDQGIVGEFGYTAYFDVAGEDVLSVREQCLP